MPRWPANGSFSDASSAFLDDLIVYTPAEIWMRGLQLVDYTPKRIPKAKTKRNDERFAGHFGQCGDPDPGFDYSRV